MSFSEAVKTGFSKAFTFTGRSRRSEFWYWYLFTFLIAIATSIIEIILPDDVLLVTILYGLATFTWTIFNAIATFAVATRRLHDIGRSGWWYGATLIFGFVWIIWFIIEIVAMAAEMPDIDAITNESAILFVIKLLGKMLIPFVLYFAYSIVLLIWFCTDSRPGANKYGPNPKEMPMAQEEATITYTEENDKEQL